MKKKILIIFTLVLLFVGGICLVVSTYNKNNPFVFDNTSKNIGVFLGLNSGVTNYYTTDDENIKYFIKKYLSKNTPPNAPEDSKYIWQNIVYYNQNHFLSAEYSLSSVELNIYNVNDGQKINAKCSVEGEGYQESNSVVSSIYPYHRTNDYSEQNICLYELGKSDFQLISLNKYLKNNETFVKRVNVDSYLTYTEYDYFINTEKRIITASVFDKANTNKNIDNVYLRSIEVAY